MFPVEHCYLLFINIAIYCFGLCIFLTMYSNEDLFEQKLYHDADSEHSVTISVIYFQVPSECPIRLDKYQQNSQIRAYTASFQAANAKKNSLAGWDYYPHLHWRPQIF